jgi:hypothetical protein
MKKTTAKEKSNKVKKPVDILPADIDLEETSQDEEHEASELDPEVLQVLTKPKKNKNGIDATDYIPELERGDIDEDPGSAPSEY